MTEVPTLVPHANEIVVAATTDIILAVLSLVSDIVTGLVALN